MLKLPFFQNKVMMPDKTLRQLSVPFQKYYFFLPLLWMPRKTSRQVSQLKGWIVLLQMSQTDFQLRRKSWISQ